MVSESLNLVVAIFVLRASRWPHRHRENSLPQVLRQCNHFLLTHEGNRTVTGHVLLGATGPLGAGAGGLGVAIGASREEAERAAQRQVAEAGVLAILELARS